jgi:predicted ArsR family transcriptional regulator
MENEGLESEDLIVLNALLRRLRLTFQEIVGLRDFNRNQTRKRLDRLIERGWVEEENRKSWKQGRKLWFALTQKGRDLLWKNTLDSVKASLEIIDLLASETLSRPQELAALREEARHTIHTIATDESMSFRERVWQTAKKREAYFGPLRKALRTMHQITLKLFASQASTEAQIGDVYLLINKEGLIEAVSEEEIIRHPEIMVTSM